VAAFGMDRGIYERQSGSPVLLTVPEMVWEMTFGICLVAKGFTSSARKRNAEPRHAAAAVPALG
jgi:hypothetical protein